MTDTVERANLLESYAGMFQNTNFLVSGFHIDYAIITLHEALREETDEGGTRLYTEDEIRFRVRNAMVAAYSR